LCHWAATLHNQAAQKEGEESKRLFRESFDKFRDSVALLPTDAFTCRSWGDAFHDCSKKLIQEAEDPECPPDKRDGLLAEASELLTLASQQFEAALKLRVDYTNAMNNWALSLSTHAKILPFEKSEEYFALAYSKFEKALQMTDTDESFIICNWAMTMVSQARKRSQNNINSGNDLLEDAKKKLLVQIDKGDTWGLFCMARWCSVANQVEECRSWLIKFQAQDNYLPRATRVQMTYFRNVSHCDWFKEMMRKGKELSKEAIDFS